jgi:predicted dehydrogenase
VRIGIIGTNWGRMHVGAFRAAGAEVVALCGLEAGKTRSVAAEERIPLATTDVAELVAASEAVVVASPASEHARHAEQALAAGRHVLIEKPLAAPLEEARRLGAIPLLPGQVAAVSFPYRMLPPFGAMAAYRASRSALHSLNASVRNSFLPDDGRSGDLGGLSHLVDAALWLAGVRPAWVSGAVLESAWVEIGLASGAVIAIAHLRSFEPGIDGHWALGGDGWEGELRAGYVPALGGWWVSPARAYAGDRWHQIAEGVRPAPGRLEPWAEAHAAAARAFLSAASGGDRGVLATVADGVRVQVVIDALIRSSREGRRIPLPAEDGP